MNATDLNRKQVAWVTGASSGIGAAVAIELASAGFLVYASGRREERLVKVTESALELGGQCRAMPVDVASSAAVAGAHERIVAQSGSVDVLVNCAGWNSPQRFLHALQPETWREVIDINLNGAAYPILAVLPAMRKARDGLIVNVSSWVGRYPTTVTGAAYASAKRALVAFGEAINAEENRHGIRACTILPALVATEILDRRPSPPSPEQRSRLLQPCDLARAVRFLTELPARVCINELLLSPTNEAPWVD